MWPETEQLLSGWGRTAPTRSKVVSSRIDAVARELTATGPRGVIARGLGRAYGDAAQNAGGKVVDVLGSSGILELDVAKGIVTAEAGLSLDDLMRIAVPLGWFPMIVPGTAHVSVGGAIAADIHGKNHRAGSFADHVMRIRLETPGRGSITAGPDSDPDTFWATAGGMGLTGVITEATLTLQPVETDRLIVDVERAADLDDLLGRMDAGDHRYQYSVAWIDCLARGRRLGRSVLTRADHAPRDAVGTGARAFNPPTLVRAPGFVPSGLLNPLSVRAFNELWFRASRDTQGQVQSLGRFFFPLDLVDRWNLVYGRRGFVQYQFVVPYGAEDTVRAALELLAGARAASFLAVIKRFDRENAGLLSFPMPGWTLALDIPGGREGLGPLFDDLDDLVLGAGGRVYLAKDARVRPSLVPEMYPELDRWREIRRRLDPDLVIVSDLDRRLDLSGRHR